MTAPDDVRARFEAWATDEGYAVERYKDSYQAADTRNAWWGFQAAHADLAGEVREWQPEETAPDGDLVDVWVGGTENGFRYANAVKLGGIWCDRNGYRLTLKGIRLWIKPPADPALAKFHPTQRATNYVSGYVDDAGKFHPTHQEKP